LINDVPVPVDPNYSLRIEAKKAFHEGNYFLSVVLSGTAVEALVKYYLIVKPEVISKSEITKIAQVYSFKFLIDEKLRHHFENDSSIDDLLKNLRVTYRRRNDVLHNYKLGTAKEEVRHNMEVLDKAIRILH